MGTATINGWTRTIMDKDDAFHLNEWSHERYQRSEQGREVFIQVADSGVVSEAVDGQLGPRWIRVPDGEIIVRLSVHWTDDSDREVELTYFKGAQALGVLVAAGIERS